MTRNQKLQWFHQVLLKLHAVDHKKDIIYQSYGVVSSKDLTDGQIDELLKRFTQAHNAKATNDPQIRKWRSHVITMLNKYGIYATNDDWSKVNGFLSNKRIAGKLLYEMNLEELKACHRKLSAMLDKWKAKQSETLRLTVMN